MDYKRIVVKIGSSTLTYPNGMLNIRRVRRIVEVLSDIKNSGLQLVVVTSAAVSLGVGKLGLPGKPADMPTKQAAAAVGQCELMYLYDKLFSEHNHTVAQLLLTGDDFSHPERQEHCRNTLSRLLEIGCIPIINENDTVAVKEIIIGDNDTLSAYVTRLCGADLLVLMSDIDGLFDSNPHLNPEAKLVPCISDRELAASMAGGSVSAVGTGGMCTKIEAAHIARDCGADMIILNGSRPDNLYLAVEGKPVGTLFPFSKGRVENAIG